MPYVAASARAKIERAKEHFDHLHTDFLRFCESKPYEIRHEVNADTSEKSVVYYPTAALPISWSIVLGELFYNLRSALDHVVYDLGPVHRSAFPIYEDRGAFFAVERKTGDPTKNSGLYKIRGITNQRTRDIIERVQPFKEGHVEGRASILYLLRELGDIDKHRTLHLCRRQAQGVRVTFVRDVHMRPGGKLSQGIFPVLDDRAELARYEPMVPNEEVDMKADIAFDIAFDEGQVPGLGGNRVESICQALIVGVEKIVGLLESSVV